MTGTGPDRPAARLAVAADAAALERLRTLAADEVADQRGGAALLAEHRPSAHRTTLVGTIGAAVVGMLSVVVAEDGPSRIEELYVETAARGVGVGAALVGTATELCRTAGSTSIDAEALPGDRSTKNFFEADGFVTRRLTVRRELRPAD